MGFQAHNLEVTPAVELQETIGNIGCTDDGRKGGAVVATRGGLGGGRGGGLKPISDNKTL